MGPTKFTTSLPFAKTARGRVAIDERLRVLVHPEEDHGPATPEEVLLFWPLRLAPLHTGRCMHVTLGWCWSLSVAGMAACIHSFGHRCAVV